MLDPPGDAESWPPGPAEAIQANTNEVEALHLVNQRLIEELEQLTAVSTGDTTDPGRL